MTKKGKDLRSMVKKFVAGMILENTSLEKLPYTKEGFVISYGGETFVIKVINKRNGVCAGDIIGEYIANEKCGDSIQ